MANPHSNTIQFYLPSGETVLLDEQDRDLIGLKWYNNGDGYAYRKSPRPEYKNVFLHRLILTRCIGRELQKGEFVDHKNGNRLDNRRSNLRVATHAENQRNMKRKAANLSGFKGVRRRGNRYIARITANGVTYELGSFRTPEEAHQAYCNAARKYHGEFARFE